MLGRIIGTILFPLWIAMIAVIFALAVTYRILKATADLVEVIGDFFADVTKLAIETLFKT